MNTKKIIIYLLILIAIILAGIIFFFNRNFLKTTLAPEKSTTISLQEKTITDNTKPFIIEIIYPQIAGFDDFNQKAKSIIDKEIAEFKKSSLENDNAVKENDPESYTKYPREYALSIGYNKGQIDNNIVSIVFNVYNYEGGAHGASYFVPLNYDIKNKKEIALVDLFGAPSALQEHYLQKISDFCIQDLTKQIIASAGSTEGTWISDGAGPVAENFQFFLINPSTSSGQATITFYFPQYQVAYGAAGDFKVTMPR